MKKSLFIFLALAIAITGFAIFVNPHSAIGASLAYIPMIPFSANVDDELSDNYDGIDFNPFEDDYDGMDDPFLNFNGGTNSFANEADSGLYFSMRLTNDTGSPVVVAINPAFYDLNGLDVTKVDGKVTDVVLHKHNIAQIALSHPEIQAIIDDGVIYYEPGTGKRLTVTGVNGKIRDHIAFTRNNPTRIFKMDVTSNFINGGGIDTAFYQSIMYLRRVSAYHKIVTEDQIDLNEFFKTEQFQPGKITVDMGRYGYQADDQTLLFVAIPAGLIITLKMYIGTTGNKAGELFKKALDAKINIKAGRAGRINPAIKKALKQHAMKGVGKMYQDFKNFKKKS